MKRLKEMGLICGVFLAGLLAGPASAAVINVRASPYNAAGNGTTDDRLAFATALGAAASGDVVVVPPGTYRIVTTSTTLTVPSGVTLLGEQQTSVINMETNGTSSTYREFIRPGGSNVTIEGLTIKRNANFPAVLFPILGGSNPSNYIMRNCTIVGNRDLYASYCHAFQIGSNTVNNTLLEGNIVRTCTYGLFQNSASTGTVNGFTVTRCLFERNYASDLEFNAPNATVSNVNVSDCVFRDNLYTTAAAGFAVGFANIQTGSVKDCLIKNYNSEALHVEDRSANINLTGNHIVGGGLIQTRVILVINASNGVTIDRNTIDGRPNTNAAYLILVTAGGTGYPIPTNVAVTNNILVNSATTSTWYLQTGTGPTPTGNVIV